MKLNKEQLIKRWQNKGHTEENTAIGISAIEEFISDLPEHLQEKINYWLDNPPQTTSDPGEGPSDPDPDD